MPAVALLELGLELELVLDTDQSQEEEPLVVPAPPIGTKQIQDG